VSANLDLVRSICAAWECGDYSSTVWAHSDIEWAFGPDGPSPTSGTGAAGMAAAWREFLSAWEEFRIEPDEYREVDHERILVLHHNSGRGKTSGVDVGQMHTRGALVFQVRTGKVVRLVGYFDPEVALTKLGMTRLAG
jgi:ketosteroid isomerase-like protein